METSLIPSSEGELVAQLKFAETLLQTGFLPTSIRTPQQALAILLTGRELGIGPMESLRQINVIQNRPTMSAQLMLGLSYKRVKGFKCHVTISNDQECVATFGREGQQDYEQRFTIKDAERMGLLQKDNWKKQPATMLRHRCISAGLRVVAPDAIAGVYTPEELNPDVKVDPETGEMQPAQDRPVVVTRIVQKPKNDDTIVKMESPDSSQAQEKDPVAIATEVFGFEDQKVNEAIEKEKKIETAKESVKKAEKPKAQSKKPRIRYNRDQIDVIDSWTIRDQLKSLGFSYNAEIKAWSAPASDDLLRSVCELTGENAEDFLNL